MRGLLFLTLMLLPATVPAQVEVAWNQPTGGIAIAVDADDNAYTVSYEYNPGGDITLTKRAADGSFLWASTYNQTDNSLWEKATWIATDHGGNALVAGTVMSGYSNPVNAASILMKYSPTGQLLWRNVYESPFDGSYTKKCLVDEDDNVYVLGMGSGPAGYVTKVKKYAPDGSTIWTYFDADGIGAPINTKFAPNGDLVIAGRAIYGSINGYARIDRDGQKVWSFPGVYSLTAGDAAGDQAGNTYLVHGVYEAGGGTTIKKLSPSGGLLWSHNYAMSAFRVEVGSDDCPVICGYPNAGTPGAAFLKVDSDGSLLWANLDADGPHTLLGHSRLILDSANNAYLAAGIMTSQAVCKVSSGGTSEWTVTIPGGGYALGIGLGTTNDVFVVGGTTAKLVQFNSASVPEVDVAGRVTLHGGSPNPATTTTTIRYTLREEADVALGLFDLSGREVLALRLGVEGPGDKSVSFSLAGLAAGTYFYRLEVDGDVKASSIRLVR